MYTFPVTSQTMFIEHFNNAIQMLLFPTPHPIILNLQVFNSLQNLMSSTKENISIKTLHVDTLKVEWHWIMTTFLTRLRHVCLHKVFERIYGDRFTFLLSALRGERLTSNTQPLALYTLHSTCIEEQIGTSYLLFFQSEKIENLLPKSSV